MYTTSLHMVSNNVRLTKADKRMVITPTWQSSSFLSHRCPGLLQEVLHPCYQLGQLLLTSSNKQSALGLSLFLPSRRLAYYYPTGPSGSSKNFLPYATIQIHYFSPQRSALNSLRTHFPYTFNQGLSFTFHRLIYLIWEFPSLCCQAGSGPL